MFDRPPEPARASGTRARSTRGLVARSRGNHTVGQNYSKIGRAPAAVALGNGRAFVTDVSLTATRQYT
ncbi:hypothetical protein D8Y22_16425 [Salinadaptatus halalkaliphilus]|uniref:Uncharacterized protein n=1 Tax=Salinadaptatus halalkaliphilus TaxID=2419781 RepID=A0A4S3TIL3_9EURY|nr:hypothetical protein D8Y22_16425 [Salinadaptatus halalkaliphilus]